MIYKLIITLIFFMNIFVYGGSLFYQTVKTKIEPFNGSETDHLEYFYHLKQYTKFFFNDGFKLKLKKLIEDSNLIELSNKKILTIAIENNELIELNITPTERNTIISRKQMILRDDLYYKLKIFSQNKPQITNSNLITLSISIYLMIYDDYNPIAIHVGIYLYGNITFKLELINRITTSINENLSVEKVPLLSSIPERVYKPLIPSAPPFEDYKENTKYVYSGNDKKDRKIKQEYEFRESVNNVKDQISLIRTNVLNF